MSTFAQSIRILELAANGARSNRAYQESYGTKQEAERQRKIEREHREAIGVLQAEAASHERDERSVRQCRERFSLCLDCELHNRCSRYSQHWKANAAVRGAAEPRTMDGLVRPSGVSE